MELNLFDNEINFTKSIWNSFDKQEKEKLIHCTDSSFYKHTREREKKIQQNL